jgi:hypothetical protein
MSSSANRCRDQRAEIDPRRTDNAEESAHAFVAARAMIAF